VLAVMRAVGVEDVPSLQLISTRCGPGSGSSPTAPRTELRAARSAFDAATVQASWSVGYVVVALWWWPAAVVAVGIAPAGWLCGRKAT